MVNSIRKILNVFISQGVDDLEIKKEENIVTIGYFHKNPVDCIRIKNNKIIYTIFERQEKLNWLFKIVDNEVYVIDDYFTEN